MGPVARVEKPSSLPLGQGGHGFATRQSLGDRRGDALSEPSPEKGLDLLARCAGSGQRRPEDAAPVRHEIGHDQDIPVCEDRLGAIPEGIVRSTNDDRGGHTTRSLEIDRAGRSTRDQGVAMDLQRRVRRPGPVRGHNSVAFAGPSAKEFLNGNAGLAVQCPLDGSYGHDPRPLAVECRDHCPAHRAETLHGDPRSSGIVPSRSKRCYGRERNRQARVSSAGGRGVRANP
jgi:hypothetical protein